MCDFYFFHNMNIYKYSFNLVNKCKHGCCQFLSLFVSLANHKKLMCPQNIVYIMYFFFLFRVYSGSNG